MHRSALLAPAALACLLSCGPSPAPSGAADATPAPAEAAPAEATPEALPTPEGVEAPPPAVKRVTPLTADEIALIEADPATLTPEMRTKRAYALRKKIMQNPDSPAAKELEEIRQKIESGELVPQLPDRSSTPPELPSGHPPSSIAAE